VKQAYSGLVPASASVTAQLAIARGGFAYQCPVGESRFLARIAGLKSSSAALGDKAARGTLLLCRRQHAVCRQSLARHPAIVSRPVDAELGREQPLDLRGEHMLPVVRGALIIARLAVVTPFPLGFVGHVQLVDSLRWTPA
jgi:hypothetical protein